MEDPIDAPLPDAVPYGDPIEASLHSDPIDAPLPDGDKFPDSGDAWTDDDEDDDDWTEDDKQLYNKQLAASHGFDVELPARSSSYFGKIGPMDVDKANPFIDFKSAAELAIQTYNGFQDRKGGELQFVKVLKCMGQVCAFMNYYLTFDAKDILSDEVGTYQAIIFENIRGNRTVSSFRCKPSDEKLSGSLPTEWIWKRN